MNTVTTVPLTIYVENTPNPEAMKFVANKPILEYGFSTEYKSKEESKGKSLLAEKLFDFPFIKSVFISQNYVSITKTDMVSWEDINFELRDFIRIFLSEGNVAVTELPERKIAADGLSSNGNSTTTSTTTSETMPVGEIERKIVAALEEYIRPAVESDGGLISFKSFENGIVTVSLKGACSGCPSATVTLKSGIETLLKNMIPEVQEVVAEQL